MCRAKIWFSRDCRWLTGHELELLSSWISIQIVVFTKSTKFFSFYYQFCIIGQKQWFPLWIILNYSVQILHNYFRFQKGYFFKKETKRIIKIFKKKVKKNEEWSISNSIVSHEEKSLLNKLWISQFPLTQMKERKVRKSERKYKREKAWWMLEKTKRKRKRRESRYPRQTVDNLFV